MRHGIFGELIGWWLVVLSNHRTMTQMVWIYLSFFHTNSRQAKWTTTSNAMKIHHGAPLRTMKWNRWMQQAEISTRPAQLYRCLNHSMMVCNWFTQLQLLRMVTIVKEFDHPVHRWSVPCLFHCKTQAHSTIHNFICQQTHTRLRAKVYVPSLLFKNALHQCT